MDTVIWWFIGVSLMVVMGVMTSVLLVGAYYFIKWLIKEGKDL